MENKKLLKFLLKDITELEELFAEKGGGGFDVFEMEFIQSRFKGAKQIIQILNEKDGLISAPQSSVIEEEPVPEEISEKVEIPVSAKESNEPEQEIVAESFPETEENTEVKPEEIIEEEQRVFDKVEPVAEGTFKEESVSGVVKEAENEHIKEDMTDDMELDEEEKDAANRTLGDSFLKEKSVNDLMGNGSSKLENKLSNSPVSSIQGAIGINDRYQYIRELFDGSAETFSKTVKELDGLDSIQEAVTYLQQNYKWKKTETSLKFVNLVKRRFLNG